jgi:tRNA pseudouridine32 synthase/23S rRNA pseudouridine746 synthase
MSRPAKPALPLRDGVAASCVWVPGRKDPASGSWPLLLDFLACRLPMAGRMEWAARLERGEVLLENGQPYSLHSECPAGQRVYYYRSIEDEPHHPFELNILWENEHLMVLDKPHFQCVNPAGRHIRNALLTRLRQARPHDGHLWAPLHRLDRETAGLMLMGRQGAARSAYQALFRQRQIEKRYWAVAPWLSALQGGLRVENRLEEGAHFMQMQEVPGQANAITHLTLLQADQQAGLALYELRPETGQKHQLRIHMAGLGVPILNDTLYPVLQVAGLEPDWAHPLQLLAVSLAFRDPFSGEDRFFITRQALGRGLPEHLRLCLELSYRNSVTR